MRADDLSQVKRAFDLNGYVGILYLLVLAVVDLCRAERRSRVDRHRDHRRERRDVRHADAGRAPARGVHVELVVSDYGRRLLRDELGEQAAVERLMPFLAAKYGADVGAGTLDAAQQPRSRRDDRERQSRMRAAWRSCRAR